MLSCHEIHQRPVIDAAGATIGEVEALLVNPTGWHVEALRVRLSREATHQVGASRGLFRGAVIDVSMAAVQSIGDTVLLRMRAEDLRPSPHQAATAYPR
ncbi:MAG: hypothetical protein HOV80_13540 [Polyangiaceae bacterium]|nr:hypothetical protein [Polyangiaceae bacterium]